MPRIQTRIEIEAPADRVWSLISGIEGYARWNPFVVFGQGDIREGNTIALRAEPEGRRGMSFRSLVTRVVPGKELRWTGHFLVPGLVDGEHIHILEPLSSGRVLYVHDEVFSGLLVPLIWRRLEAVTREGFERMNHAAKQTAEREGRA